MSKLQAVYVQATQQASTTYDASTQALTPPDVTYFDQPATSDVIITLSPASGTTIIGVTSDQGLTWTQQTGTPNWASSSLAMPALGTKTDVNITVQIPGLFHDPTFTVNNKKRT
ncbi:hypothetical protein [Enhygromyxa salina]|uniref:Uncharacterized protein n=1 Tax=Enhygromyxa salina TaxID=215803 RepID=A0A2S9Y7W9_9BACT|nr:hypothetical protein [Enhygromyxa salina]PRQ01152.1 hypothetical protein ENSA7_57570 [Enhygromyxa salina]